MKLSSKMLQNLPYFWNKKTQIFFFRFSFWVTLDFLQWMPMENLCIKRVRSSTTVGGIHTYIHFLKTHFYLKLFALSNLPSFAWKYNYLMKNKIHILIFFFTFLISSQTLLMNKLICYCWSKNFVKLKKPWPKNSGNAMNQYHRIF